MPSLARHTTCCVRYTWNYKPLGALIKMFSCRTMNMLWQEEFLKLRHPDFEKSFDLTQKEKHVILGKYFLIYLVFKLLYNLACSHLI